MNAMFQEAVWDHPVADPIAVWYLVVVGAKNIIQHRITIFSVAVLCQYKDTKCWYFINWIKILERSCHAPSSWDDVSQAKLHLIDCPTLDMLSLTNLKKVLHAHNHKTIDWTQPFWKQLQSNLDTDYSHCQRDCGRSANNRFINANRLPTTSF